jgi:LmbE family N-acetylglucosaminyl deacetylase
MATLVFVHAHPDDEALLTAGTMAKAAAAGHRVVLIMATDGGAGLTRSDITDVADVRAAELQRSSDALGVARVVSLGYPDSGLSGIGGFSQIDTNVVADRIAEVVVEERADILVGYDAAGGYGHPDHQKVHVVTRRAAAMRPHVRLFEATLPREPIRFAVHLAARLHVTPSSFDPREFDRAWTPRREITNRVDVRSFLPAKLDALRAHSSQAQADSGVRTLQVLTQIPKPLAALLLGTEYYVSV